MVTTGVQKFYVNDSPFQADRFNLANTSSAGYDPTDRERLFIHYNPAAGKITLDPIAGKYGNNRANTLGGNYDFDPNGDYLNSGGMWGPNMGQGRQQPINYTGQGLDQARFPATGPGGGIYGDDSLRIGIPRMSATPNGYGGPIQCPYGFYTVGGNTCLPNVNLDPTRPENILGINSTGGMYQDVRGVILRVITPVKTQKGQLFQIVTQVKNLGNQPGKISTKVSIPMLNITEVESNSAMLEPGKEAVVYQTLPMPATLPPGMAQLIPVTSDLWVTSLKSPAGMPQKQDSNTATMPSPDTVLGSPPPIPAMPNIPQLPIPQGQPGGFNPGTMMPYPMPMPRPMPLPQVPFQMPMGQKGIIILPQQLNYGVGQTVGVMVSGYNPYSMASIQIYTKTRGSGIFIGNNNTNQVLTSTQVPIGPSGMSQPLGFNIPNVRGGGGGISIMGMINIGGGSGAKEISIISVGQSGNNMNKKYEKTIKIA